MHGTSNGIDEKGLTRQTYLNSLDSAESTNSLIFWTSDTAFATNAKLMHLLDTLYQHVREDDFPAQAKEEEMWMSGKKERPKAMNN